LPADPGRAGRAPALAGGAARLRLPRRVRADGAAPVRGRGGDGVPGDVPPAAERRRVAARDGRPARAGRVRQTREVAQTADTVPARLPERERNHPVVIGKVIIYIITHPCPP